MDRIEAGCRAEWTDSPPCRAEIDTAGFNPVHANLPKIESSICKTTSLSRYREVPTSGKQPTEIGHEEVLDGLVRAAEACQSS